MGGGLLNIVSYGNINVFITGNPKKSFFVATYKKYTNFGLQKHIINCNVTNSSLRENNITKFDFTIPRWGDLLLDTFFVIQMPYIWSPVWVEPSDRNITPGGCGTIANPTCSSGDNPDNFLQDCVGYAVNPSNIVPEYQTGIYKIRDPSNSHLEKPVRKLGSAQIPHCQPFEFKWIEDLGAQMMTKVSISIAGTIIQEYTGEYLTNLVKREFTQEKKEIFDRMTANISEMNNPGFAGKRKGLYPNCLYSSISQFRDSSANIYWSLYNRLEDLSVTRDPNIRTNITPSIDKRLLTIPLNLWYMFSSSQSFPLVSLTNNALKISIECRPIRELFVIRDVRQYINTYYGHSFAKGNTTQVGSGLSIYEDLSANYYSDYENALDTCGVPPCGPGSAECWRLSANYRQLYYSQFNLFKPYNPPPFISTINTTDPLYQMYMFTTQYPSTNQAFLQEAALQTQLSADIAAYFRPNGLWTANPRLCSTYVYLDHEEQLVFRSRPQSYLIKQMQTIIFEKINHNAYASDRFKSNNIVSNWMWFLQRSDVNLRNQWNNYSNWQYKGDQDYTLQLLYYKNLKQTYYNSDSNINDLSFIQQTNNIANPYYNFSNEPKMWELTTANMLPNNFSLLAKYSIDTSFNYGICVSDSFSGLAIGSTYVGSGMNLSPPYFPFTYDSSNNKGVFPYITGPYKGSNKTILNNWSLILDGKIREERLDATYYNTVEPFLRTSGGYTEGLYTYNFGLNSSPYDLDPNGAMNLIKYRHIDFEYDNVPLLPILDPSRVAIIPICDSSGNSYGYNKTDWQIYDYTFNLKLFEETYNVLTIEQGLASLEFNSYR
jgi:hypothetical protein